MRRASSWLARATLLVAAGLAACSDDISPTAPTPPPEGGTPGKPVTVQILDCQGSRETLTVSCAGPEQPTLIPGTDIIVGGQGIFVQVTTSGVAYNSGTGQFTFTTTIQNLIEQEMGTTDDVVPDPNGIRVFFHQGPTVTGGTGVVAVVPDGFATFTAAGQPYYQYNGILEHNAVSAGKVWTLTMPPTVTTFDFRLYVSAPVPYPNGYVTMNTQLPGYYLGDLHPGSTRAMVAVSKTAVGVVIPGTTITFATSDPLCATVSSGGLITGVRAQNCDISASDGTRSGYCNLTVTGAVRTWTGAVSADWSNGGNWGGGLSPADVDTASIPFGVANYPALVAATAIGGVDVADNATLSLGSYDLTATANVATGATAGSGILSTTGRLVLAGPAGAVHGRLPATLVTGTYSLDGDVYAVAAEQVDSGLLVNENHALIGISQ